MTAAPTVGHTMAKYIAWHLRNCRCVPQDNTANHIVRTPAPSPRRRDNQEKT